MVTIAITVLTKAVNLHSVHHLNNHSCGRDAMNFIINTNIHTTIENNSSIYHKSYNFIEIR